ncbi:MAG: hypothetical protein JKX83_07250 [Pseudomonadales bacterium]|nr:hypothetical protein [Pseudomonadales bacterium]
MTSFETDSSFTAQGGKAYEFGVNLVISRQHGTFRPFIKLGAGIGNAPASFINSDQDTLTSVHVSGAFGLKFALTQKLSFVGSIEAVYRAWHTVDLAPIEAP